MERLSGSQVTAALTELGKNITELAQEFGMSERSTRRWSTDGCTGAAATAITLALRLYRAGIPWRDNEVAIGLAEGGQISFLTDAEAAREDLRWKG
jgi:hypothetical protein